MHRRRSATLAAHLSTLLVTLWFSSGRALAHSLPASRFDAPIPLSLLFGGAGATVALTALWLAVRGADEATLGRARTLATVGPRVALGSRRLAQSLFVVAVVAAMVAGFTGRQVAAENVATVFTWPLWFRGLALLAIVVGSVWPTLSPWRLVYEGLVRVEGRAFALRSYPERLAEWPALLGFLLLLGILENLTNAPQSPRLTTVVVAGYGFVMVGGSVLYGREWFDRADPLGVLYELFGRVAPLSVRRTERGGDRIDLRPPWQGCLQPVGSFALVTFVVAAVYTVSFDGFANTGTYQSVLFEVRAALELGAVTSIVLYLGGLLGFVLAFAGASHLTERLGAADTARWRETARAFAPTVVPIAAGYEVAHNYPYVVENVGRLLSLVVPGVGPLDPLGWLSLPVFWGSQVLLVVVGHVVAVVAAHAVAVRRYGGDRAARGHLPFVVVMVGYTVLSLWIISQPVVS